MIIAVIGLRIFKEERSPNRSVLQLLPVNERKDGTQYIGQKRGWKQKIVMFLLFSFLSAKKIRLFLPIFQQKEVFNHYLCKQSKN